MPIVPTAAEAAAWDAGVLAHVHGSFLQSCAWGRLKQQFGWAPVRLRLPARGDELSAMGQVLFRRIPYSPYTVGYLPRGPLLDYQDEGALSALEARLATLARRYRAVSITWEPPVLEGSGLPARLRRLGLRLVPGIQPRSTIVVDLTPEPEQILAREHTKWRYNTRLAQKRGVTVRAAGSVADLSRWYRVLEATTQRDGFAAHSELYYRSFWQAGYKSGDTALLLAEHEGRLLAGIMVHRFGHDATYLYGASADEGRNLMPNHLLQWEAMLWARQRGARRYDLYGIPDTDAPDEPLAGVARFKAGFGGQVVRYMGAFDRVYHPALYKLLQRARQLS